MAGIKNNRRTLYTKKVIKEALIDLLNLKEIHKITVTDICQKANINRGTFYFHYKDAFHLLETLENELFDKVLQYIKEVSVENYKDDLLLKVLTLIKENKELCTILFCKQKDSRILSRVLFVARKADFEGIIDTYSRGDKTYMDYYIKYCVGGVFAIIQSWLERGLEETPKEMVVIINSVSAK